jgi:hypothetical protein
MTRQVTPTKAATQQAKYLPLTKAFPAGARVKCSYRGNHVGTLLADDDPRGWIGSLAFPEGIPTVEQVRAHIAHYRSMWPDLAAHDATRAVVAWDFGKVYWESADSLSLAEVSS